MKPRLIYAVALLLLLALVGAGCAPGTKPSPATPTPPGAVQATKVLKYTPTAPGGEERAGSCWTTSIASPRAGAWRCALGNEIQDPCFTLEEGKSVVCGADPTTGTPGFKVRLTKPLPEPSLPPQTINAGWLIELADGTFCRPYTGTRGIVDEGKRMATYYCTGGTQEEPVVLLDDLQAGTIWKAEKATLTRGAQTLVTKQSEIVPIRTVWQ